MFFTAISAVDWANVWEQIKNFFIGWYNNDLAFYLGVGGIALLFVAILAFIIAGAHKKKAKKAQKAAKAKKAEKKAAAPVAAPVAKPAVAATKPVAPATPAYTAPVTPAYTAPVTPVYTAPVEEPVAPVYNEPLASLYTEPEAPLYNVPSEEPVAEPYAAPFDVAPVQKEQAVEEVVEKDERKDDIPEEYVPAEEAAPVQDDSWKSAKINLKRKPAASKEEDEKPAPAAKKPAAKKAVKAEAPAEEEKVKETPVKKAAPKKAAVKAEAAPEVAPEVETEKKTVADKPKVVGKYTIVDNGYSYQFCLFANNGQLLYESREYASMASCKSGIATFKKNVVACEYRVDMDKNGGYKYIFKKGNSLYIGETYSTSKAAERSAESVKRFADISELSE